MRGWRRCWKPQARNSRKRVRSNNDDSDRRARASIGSLYQFFPTKEQVAATLIEQHVTELEAAFDRLSEEVPLLNVSVVAGRLTTLFVAFRTTYPVLAHPAIVTRPASTAGKTTLRGRRMGTIDSISIHR